MSWKGEKYRHGMAARGIKTAREREDEALIRLTSAKESLEELVDDIYHSGLRTLTEAQLDVLHNRFHNLWPGSIMISHQFLLIPEESMGNWNYYAGFEYIKIKPQKVGMYYVFSRNDSERVEQVIDMLEEGGE